MWIPADSNPTPGGARLAVLGGCGGIGRELIRAAIARGLQIAVLDLPASLEKYPVPEGVAAYPVDAAVPVSLENAFDQLDSAWNGLDGFVNLCGFMHDNQATATMPEPTWREIVNGNLDTVFYAAQRAIPLLSRGSGGSIVHVASGLAHNIRWGFGAYATAKAGVIALTKTLALENAPTIRVNAVAPAAVDTAFLRGGTGRSDESEAPHINIDQYVNAIPLGRIATPHDIVGPILFLLGEDAGYMSGQVLWVNGGSYMP